MSATVLMIDDDRALLRLTELSLTKAGYQFIHAEHGIDGVQALERAQPALVLLDISMPRLNGWETCRLIREISTVPIIIVTGRDDEADKARGLDLGADDYLTKPFGFVELHARVRAALRRAALPAVTRRKVHAVYTVGSLVVNVAAHTVVRHDVPVLLTPTEFRLLTQLLENADLVLTHRQLLTAVWGFAYGDATDVLKPTISRLRQKIEDDPAQPRIIQTVHGVGYRLMLPIAASDECGH
ncbi:MAG TPA: response regulator transcription factor [Chloroflexota bacterium]|jgi:DNA-binding response OmpR family regulator